MPGAMVGREIRSRPLYWGQFLLRGARFLSLNVECSCARAPKHLQINQRSLELAPSWA